ncbi:hypothetical protein M406DRAFT_71385 [Cryphonectria parasitica EP155]|uniref:Protein kinase domain-containing protein n=1 Tax=Cryphonectria parasitica (strain ATCC 38755 / EP155) TaxID=660469 RepID=A0A9P4Y7U3_CRYP1|nr:uncharacterized protein M406DRAFT_71385 [Cryphonectria parasitica EP155]KAF3768331.1 hypothetical protein M406DRAFT_71385 [Cryphonectria parasitica EP155]
MIPQSVFCVPFEVAQKRAGCWILGSGTNIKEIDFKVAKDNRQGVSKKCLRIDFVIRSDGKPVLRITNELENAKLCIQYSEHSTEDVIHLAKGNWNEIEKSVIIRHSKFTFRMWLPSRTRLVTKALEYWPPLDSEPATVNEASCISRDGILYTKVPELAICAAHATETSGRVFILHLAIAIDIAYMANGAAPLWLILEHVPFSLSTYICDRRRWPKAPLPPVIPTDIISQIACFLIFLHGQNLVHRDLSLRNIRLSPEKTR